MSKLSSFLRSNANTLNSVSTLLSVVLISLLGADKTVAVQQAIEDIKTAIESVKKAKQSLQA